MDESIFGLGVGSDLGPGVLDAHDGVLVAGLVAEDGRARDDGVAAGGDHLVGVSRADTAVDLDPGVDTLGLAHFPELADLVQLALDELLPAKAGVDRHDEDQVGDIQDVLDRRERGGGVKNDAGLAAQVLDLVQGAVQVDGRAALGVDRDDIGTGLGKVGDPQLGLDNPAEVWWGGSSPTAPESTSTSPWIRVYSHQVDIKGLVGVGADGIDDQGADRDVGDEPAVHHIDVDPVATGLINGLDLRGRRKAVQAILSNSTAGDAPPESFKEMGHRWERNPPTIGASTAPQGKRVIACLKSSKCGATLRTRCRETIHTGGGAIWQKIAAFRRRSLLNRPLSRTL